MFSVGISQLRETTRSWRDRLVVGMFLSGIFAFPPCPRRRVAFFRLREAPPGAHNGSAPRYLFSGAVSALLGKDREPVRLQPVRRGRSFVTFSFVGFLSEVFSSCRSSDAAVSAVSDAF